MNNEKRLRDPFLKRKIWYAQKVPLTFCLILYESELTVVLESDGLSTTF
jgi:hypothetical protein